MSTLTTPPRNTFRANQASNVEQLSPAKSLSLSPSKLFLIQDRPQFHNLSSSVLQHSSESHRFPQADRFPALRTVGPQSYCASPSSLTAKSTSLGFGGKIDLSTFKMKDSGQFPSPNKYHLKSGFENDGKKGKSFGLSYAAYEKVYVPGNREIPIPYTKHFPGPGAYYTSRDIPSNMTKMTLSPKGKMFNEELYINSPKCSQYTPKTVLTQNNRFAKPTFGFGNKLDLAKALNDNPGPGAYSPPSFVDILKKKKSKKA